MFQVHSFRIEHDPTRPDDLEAVTITFTNPQGAILRIWMNGTHVFEGEDGPTLEIPQVIDFIENLAAAIGYEVDLKESNAL